MTSFVNEPTVERSGYRSLSHRLIETRCFDDAHSKYKRRLLLDLAAILAVAEEDDGRCFVKLTSGTSYVDIPFETLATLIWEYRQV